MKKIYFLSCLITLYQIERNEIRYYNCILIASNDTRLNKINAYLKHKYSFQHKSQYTWHNGINNVFFGMHPPQPKIVKLPN